MTLVSLLIQTLADAEKLRAMGRIFAWVAIGSATRRRGGASRAPAVSRPGARAGASDAADWTRRRAVVCMALRTGGGGAGC